MDGFAIPNAAYPDPQVSTPFPDTKSGANAGHRPCRCDLLWRGLQGAAARQADCGKIVIAVSEDIGPDNTDAVMGSFPYRSNPIEDVPVEPYRSMGHAPKSGLAGMDSALLIDATLRYPMAPLALPGRAFMERGQALWKDLGLPKLTVRSPWHGYSLGDVDRRVGDCRAQCRRRRLGQERQRNLAAAAGRADTGDAGTDSRGLAAQPSIDGGRKSCAKSRTVTKPRVGQVQALFLRLFAGRK